MRGRLRRAAVVVAVAGAGLAGTGVATATEATVAPGIQWRPCNRGFECATVPVPLDYDDPRGPTILIAVTRLPAADPASRIGSIFLNPGGPGGSGVDFTQAAAPFLFTQEVRDRFDLVGFDPRGIYRSNQLQCFPTRHAQNAAIAPFAFPVTPEEEVAWVGYDNYLVASCDRRASDIIDHMATADVARDMDRMRALVGDETLTYVGYSYGSYLGTTYANMYPRRVRAVIVDAVLDPIAWATGRGDEADTLPFSTRLRSAEGAQDTLDEFFRLCDAGGPACAFSGNAADRYAAMLEQLLEEPLDLGGDVITYADVIGGSLGELYDSFGWPNFAEILAFIESQLPSARPAAPASAEDLRRLTAFAPKYNNFVEGFPGVGCSDTDNPDSPSAWADAASVVPGYFGPLWTWITSVCASWHGVDDDRFIGPFTHRTANPVLVVGNLFDPATPYHGAQTVADLMPNASLLTVHGWGHASLFLSACADAAIAAYLIDVATPAPGTVCEQDVVPFAEPANPARAAAAAAARAAVGPYLTFSRQ